MSSLFSLRFNPFDEESPILKHAVYIKKVHKEEIEKTSRLKT